jgi:roadblock/LC7 domain-containing protein
VPDTAVRGTIDEVHGLAGVVIVLDTEDGRVVAQRGVEEDPLEIVLHFTGTWDELLAALLPVLGDGLQTRWTPERWWACSGGDHTAMGRDGRAVIVDASEAGPFLAALAGDGTVTGVRVW